MLGRFGSMLGPCWVIWWAFGVPWRFLEGKNNPQQKVCPLRVFFGDFWGLCRANVGPFWVYVGSLDGLLGFHGGFWREKTTPNTKACRLKVILANFLGLCRANVGPFWVYVGPMLGHWMGFWGFHGGFWREKNQRQRESLYVACPFWNPAFDLEHQGKILFDRNGTHPMWQNLGHRFFLCARRNPQTRQKECLRLKFAQTLSWNWWKSWQWTKMTLLLPVMRLGSHQMNAAILWSPRL